MTIRTPAKKRNKPSKKIIEIKKANQIVEGKYKFDVWETRIFFKMLSMIDDRDSDLKSYRIDLSDLIDDFKVKRDKRAYERFLNGARKLLSKKVKVYLKDTDEVLETYLLTGTKTKRNVINEEDKYISVTFHPDLKDVLLKVKDNFTLLQFEALSKLPSSYSIRVYELLKQYKKIGWREIALTDLKEMVGAIELIEHSDGHVEEKDHYPLFGNFNQRVLKKAQNDLKKHTDITFKYKNIKRGKSVDRIYFTITHNQNYEHSNAVSEEDTLNKNIEQDALFEEIYERVKDWEDITKAGLKNAIRKFTSHQIKAAVAQTQDNYSSNPGSIQSRGKYFYALAKVPTLWDDRSSMKDEQKKTIERNKKIENIQNQKEQRKRQLHREYFDKQFGVVLQLMDEIPTLEKTLRDVLIQRIGPEKVDDDLFDTPRKKGIVAAYLVREYPDRFKDIKEEYEPLINEIAK